MKQSVLFARARIRSFLNSSIRDHYNLALTLCSDRSLAASNPPKPRSLRIERTINFGSHPDISLTKRCIHAGNTLKPSSRSWRIIDP